MKNTDSKSLVSVIREASRSMVRELGMLGEVHASQGVSNSQAHTLIELERSHSLSVIELAKCLCLEKSSVSRLVDSLVEQDLIKTESDPKDARRKILKLSPLGQKKLLAIHAQAEKRVSAALRTLNPQERNKIVEGLSLYADALMRSKSIN